MLGDPIQEPRTVVLHTGQSRNITALHFTVPLDNDQRAVLFERINALVDEFTIGLEQVEKAPFHLITIAVSPTDE
ncbi:hypothetical protein [Maritalea sp.]|uniref:hypothetical protein n=1 Tax=Maritalea sp. TaxID=2003361 RepID=UPI003EF59F0A